MTVREVGELIIWMGAIAGALTAVAIVLRFAIVRPIKSWIVEQTQPSRYVASQLNPNGQGESVRDLLQSTTDKVDKLSDEINHNREYAETTRAMTINAMTLAQTVAARLESIDQKITAIAFRRSGQDASNGE